MPPIPPLTPEHLNRLAALTREGRRFRDAGVIPDGRLAARKARPGETAITAEEFEEIASMATLAPRLVAVVRKCGEVLCVFPVSYFERRRNANAAVESDEPFMLEPQPAA